MNLEPNTTPKLDSPNTKRPNTTIRQALFVGLTLRRILLLRKEVTRHLRVLTLQVRHVHALGHVDALRALRLRVPLRDVLGLAERHEVLAVVSVLRLVQI